MISSGIKALTGDARDEDAWARFISPKDVVGIKVNCSGAPRICSAARTPGRRPGCATTRLIVASRSRGRRATVSDCEANHAVVAASTRSSRRKLGSARSARRSPYVESPAAETSTRRSTRCGKEIASSAPMKPPIELPTTAAASISSWSRRPSSRRA